MKLIGCLILTAALTFGQAAPGVQLKAAAHKEEVEGDLKGAMEVYRKIIAAGATDRAVAAEAMLRLARCHEKLGQAEARKLYEQIVTSYRDQNAAATQARVRLAALDGSSKSSTGLAARQVWTGSGVDAAMSITPDGKTMAITHWDTGDVAIREMATGQIQRLNLKASWNESADFAEWPVLAPDRSQIAFAWYSDKDRRYQMRLTAARPGSKPRTLVDNPEIEYFETAGWAPDGQSILAGIWRMDGTTQLAWISAKDGSIKPLKSLEWRNPQRISLSPDGRQIAYDVLQREDGPDRDIYVLASDGSRENALMESPGHEAALSWTPDGQHLLFLSNRSGRMDLLAAPVREGKLQGAPRMVKADIGDVEPIGFSNSGLFYYVSRRGDEDIYSVELDPATGKGRGSPARIAQSFQGKNHRAAWSADGKWIAFLSSRGHSRWGPGAVSIVVQSVATREESVFTPNLTLGARPVWLHSGSAILVAARERQGTISFHKLDIRSGKFELVLATGTAFNPVVGLTSDDRTLYAPVNDDSDKSSRIVRFDLQGGKQETVYRAPKDGHVTGLALSPDGRSLAISLFTKRGEKQLQQVALASIDGKVFQELTEQGDPGSIVPVLGLDWSPDSRWVYFVRVKKPEGELWRVPAAGGAAEFTGVSAAGLKHIHMTSDGSQMAFSAGERVNQELWVLENLMPVLKASR
jgi:Tol biopolymer transport system component